ncbi:cytochrome c [Marinobacterium nitratireducens]|uniref:Cytochrome c n=1 Tax=Marinobacterium nitratireducens TaxID=518897 RepID=A0A918DV97_9GAMM|nr:ABC transporter substrate-binding protein [Marinobacterium nitratireducens]GGO85660.1 cytochrome c [Marinobacterium nitratireducens]
MPTRPILTTLLSACLLLPNPALGEPASALGDALGVSVSDLGNPYFVAIARSAERRAQALSPGIRVEVLSSAYDLQRQIGQIDHFIASGARLILLSAADPEAIAPAVTRARDAGVRVIAIDVEASGADVTITTDNRQAGSQACHYLAERIGGTGRVVIINGPPVSSIIERVEGCREALDHYPGIELLSDSENGAGAREGGMEKMTALMTAHPDIQGVFAVNDPSALGAEQAARQAGRDSFVIVSVDGSPAAIERLQQPGSLLQATAAQFPRRIARRAVDTGAALLSGERIEQQRILIAPKLITSANAAEYQGWSETD